MTQAPLPPSPPESRKPAWLGSEPRDSMNSLVRLWSIPAMRAFVVLVFVLLIV
jgi:hypothetical protein